MNKKTVYRILATLLGATFLFAGAFLLSPVFDGAMKKLNGIVFVVLSVYMFYYSITGKEKLRSGAKRCRSR